MKRLVISIVGAFIILLIGFRLWQFIGSATPEHGMALEPNEPVADFVLTDQFGVSRHLTEWRGEVVVLFFGYTNCPDVCPLTLAQLNRTLTELEGKAEQVQVVLVSVDPKRDTPERLREYLGAFNRAFIGLTGTDAQITNLTTRMGVYAAPSEESGHEHGDASGTSATESGLIDHTATVFVLDKEGYLRLLFPPNTDGVAMAEDIDMLLK